MDYTQNSARAHRNTLVTDSLTPIAGGVQGTTNQEEELACAAILPQDLTIPQPNSQQRVPLDRRPYGSIKVKTAVDTKDGTPTNDKLMRLVMMVLRSGADR